MNIFCLAFGYFADIFGELVGCFWDTSVLLSYDDNYDENYDEKYDDSFDENNDKNYDEN